MTEIPILEYKGKLIVSVQIDLSDSVAVQLQENILNRIENSCAKGLVIDISSLDMVDSFIAKVFMETAHMAQLMNVQTIIVGMKPEVALTLVTMGFTLKGVQTALDLETGLDYLEKMTEEGISGEKS
jgi:rsbT antagonist protein RsbS